MHGFKYFISAHIASLGFSRLSQWNHFLLFYPYYVNNLGLVFQGNNHKIDFCLEVQNWNLGWLGGHWNRSSAGCNCYKIAAPVSCGLAWRELIESYYPFEKEHYLSPRSELLCLNSLKGQPNDLSCHFGFFTTSDDAANVTAWRGCEETLPLLWIRSF